VTVAFDARDAEGAQPRGWGRYAARLLQELPQALAESDLELWPISRGGPGPEMLFEQVRLPWALRRRGAALVHAPNCFLPLVRPCPGVVTIHDLAFETWPRDFARSTGWKYRTITRAAARSAERIICPSRFTADDVCTRYGVDESRVRVIPEAPALPGGVLPSPPGPYVLAVGDLRVKKNLGALVRAFVSLRRSRQIPHRLVLAGLEAGAGSALRDLAAPSAAVEFTGYLTDAQLDALIRGAEVLVHPSLYEGFGLVVLEAMERGTPVLAARATALPETGGEAAAWFDPAGPAGGAEELARVLGRLLEDERLRAQLADRGRQWVKGFSWARAARETVAVYRELL
jgi:glycosyltransferase involved in cell wall biosynthesis